MGRDHHNLQLTVAHTREAARVGTARVTEWRLFRNEVNVETTIDNVDNWLKEVLDTAVRHAKRIKLNEEVPAVDIHFIHLWEARRRTLRTKTTWHILHIPLGNGPTRTQLRHHLCRLLQNYAGWEENLLQELQKRLCGDPSDNTTAHGNAYGGKPKPELHQPITLAEISVLLSRLTRNTIVGNDRISHKHLRNLSQQAIAALLQYFNECWEKGELRLPGRTRRSP
ncbi:hypothetical protein HPB52_008231 [Rhipicephalus sanguineus]|uniref:Tick transposon n=1 Tax=Rhipicephalus sanguineus TaxID=34632 RepID=A0A9D4SR15_RHISA|nr:hypothetical protein HPB52_008231 [Rhipicephalus sanguineus]